jgi:uncharacterized protein (DUF2141 family)
LGNIDFNFVPGPFNFGEKIKHMKKTILFLALIGSTLAVAAQTQPLTVHIKNVNSDKGTLRVGIFNSQADFLKKQLYGQIVKSKNGDVQVVFENVPVGAYAVSIIHDENENGELDSNFFGIPKEGFGFSNDAMGTFGPPSFEKASFKLTENTALTINLKYM